MTDDIEVLLLQRYQRWLLRLVAKLQINHAEALAFLHKKVDELRRMSLAAKRKLYENGDLPS